MADRIIELTWKCGECGTDRILGRNKRCSNCGSPSEAVTLSVNNLGGIHSVRHGEVEIEVAEAPVD